jgi:acylphosphatase
MLRWELKVTGQVQGVFYRHSAVQVAERLGLGGYVRNLPDGSVACVIEGKREALEEFLAWARRGPPAAQVHGVTVVEREPEGDRGFHVAG